MECLIFLPESENFFLKEIDPSFHCFVQNASAGIDGSGLLFHSPVNLSPHDGILIEESSGSACHFYELRNRYPLSLTQQFTDRPFRCGYLFITSFPVHFNHPVVFVHILHPIHLNLRAGFWSVVPVLFGFLQPEVDYSFFCNAIICLFKKKNRCPVNIHTVISGSFVRNSRWLSNKFLCAALRHISIAAPHQTGGGAERCYPGSTFGGGAQPRGPAGHPHHRPQ